jgi:pSer/pThr/pTyr-binding forkhead associated (FHA) protein
MIAIGVVAGAAIGLIENAAKAGWLKVTSGIIAGKQFILYRNPTYIGSAPDCQIYLFKDPRVGKRHAAIHLAPSGIEIEDLPLGDATFVNGKPVTRAALKHGDQVKIGATQFLFQERRPK